MSIDNDADDGFVFDLTTQELVTPIMDQFRTATCNLHAKLAAVEATYKMKGKTHQLLHLSPQQVIDLDDQAYALMDPNDPEAYLHPQWIGIWAGVEFDEYDDKKGVFLGPDAGPNGEEWNHSVAIIGFGTTIGKVGYWLCKNSWGPTWGENGHIRIARGPGPHGMGYAAILGDAQVATLMDDEDKWESTCEHYKKIVQKERQEKAKEIATKRKTRKGKC